MHKTMSYFSGELLGCRNSPSLSGVASIGNPSDQGKTCLDRGSFSLRVGVLFIVKYEFPRLGCLLDDAKIQVQVPSHSQVQVPPYSQVQVRPLGLMELEG